LAASLCTERKPVPKSSKYGNGKIDKGIDEVKYSALTADPGRAARAIAKQAAGLLVVALGFSARVIMVLQLTGVPKNPVPVFSGVVPVRQFQPNLWPSLWKRTANRGLEKALHTHSR